MTFSEPTALYFGKEVRVLTTLDEKLRLIGEFGIDYAIIADFGEIASLSGEEFVKKVLVSGCRVKSAVCGFNFRFGRGAECTSDDLAEAMRSCGGAAHVVRELKLGGVTVSSTAIRRAIERGDMVTANAMLGRPFSLTGAVVRG